MAIYNPSARRNLSTKTKLSINSTAKSEGQGSSSAHDDGSLYTNDKDPSKGYAFERYRPDVGHWDDRMSTPADDFDSYLYGTDKFVHDDNDNLVMVDKDTSRVKFFKQDDGTYKTADGKREATQDSLRPLGRSVQAEIDFEEDVLRPLWSAQQERHRKKGNKSRLQDFDSWKAGKQKLGRCKQRETIIQIGNADIPERDLSKQTRIYYEKKACASFIEKVEAVGGHISSIDFHFDEASPHIHIRYYVLDSKGQVSFENALKEHGYSPTAPKPDKHHKGKRAKPLCLNTWTRQTREEIESEISDEMVNVWHSQPLNTERKKSSHLPNGDYQEQREKAQAELDEIQQRSNQASQQLRVITDDLDKRRKEKEALDRSYAVRLKELEVAEKRNAELEKCTASLSDLNSQITAKKAELQTATASVANKKAELQTVTDDVTSKRDTLQSVSDDVDDLKVQKAELQKFIDDAKKEQPAKIVSLNESVKEAASELEVMRMRARDAASDAQFLGSLPGAMDLVDVVRLPDWYRTGDDRGLMSVNGRQQPIYRFERTRGHDRYLTAPESYLRDSGTALWLPKTESIKTVDSDLSAGKLTWSQPVLGHELAGKLTDYVKAQDIARQARESQRVRDELEEQLRAIADNEKGREIGGRSFG